ncbi:transposase domain-containing protein [Micromonospora sp. C95]|uniref:transposase domain-containing protein n=1 Tax=Micromonospora sp. C95 TaxID=2824882 RepID=UPI001B379258|nr:transposase domain-containing protein [Micromonospora sp. C95]MBQ1026067.1 transposase domain-containing protein [Micromonospora sp. C95]
MIAEAQVVGGRLPEWISMGVLAGSVPREVVDGAVEVAGRQAPRSDAKLPPHGMVYFALASASYADAGRNHSGA